MSHYEKEFSEYDESIKKEIRKRTKKSIDKLTDEELELVFMIVTNIKDFVALTRATKLLSK